MLAPRDPEFPAAVLLPRTARWELWRWAVAKWTWVRPRTVPLLVAAAGMIFLLASADYLAHVPSTPVHTIPAFK